MELHIKVLLDAYIMSLLRTEQITMILHNKNKKGNRKPKKNSSVNPGNENSAKR